MRTIVKSSGGRRVGAMAFELRSPAFAEDGLIAKKYTCDGSDISVPLSWRNPPEGTESFALILDDPDAPSATWVHWVLYDLPATSCRLAEGLPPEKVLADGVKQGLNDFGRIGYGGPCPPHGPAHRYCFKLFALNSMTGLHPGATKPELLRAMKGHILGQTQLTAFYGRE